MRPPWIVSPVPREGHEELAVAPGNQGASAWHDLAAPVRRAIARGNQWLLGQQRADGHWVAELEGDTILESETILLLAFLGQERSELARRAAQYLVEKQLPQGGWAMYPGGGVEVSGSVKAYFALKLTGHDPGAELMQRARRAILEHGGADAVNSFTRFYLALLDQISYDQCPEVPPEAVLLPKWFPVNLYAVSSWSRTIIVPLSIVSAMRPVRRLEPRLGIRELFLKPPDQWPPLRCPGLRGGTGLLSWDRFFRTVDRVLKGCRHHGLLPWRRRAIRAAERWMLERFERSDGLGAIYPPIVWSLLALKCLGYGDSSPEVAWCRRQLEDLVIGDPASGSVRLQPCKSPVWDTAIAVRALLAAGGLAKEHRIPDGSGPFSYEEAIRKANQWLLERQITRRGDWAETVDAEPGGWCFEYHNDFYPDSDDTAMVLMALREQFRAGEKGDGTLLCEAPAGPLGQEGSVPLCFRQVDGARERVAAIDRAARAMDRGLRWMLAMQNKDGGWGAFDRDNDRQFLCHVPFADHNAMIDPSTPDLTGRVLEALGAFGRRVGDPAVDRGVAYLRRSQQADGSWFGRWGVNYVYGTWQALVGLAAVGVPAEDPAVAAATNWLLSCQQPCGAWGESAHSYEDPRRKGMGPPTASQTAWALMGLLAAGLEAHPAVERGVRYLIQTQQEDGTWEESEFTGTGFPRVFYLRYHYYRVYFPLLALCRWYKATSHAE